MIATPNKTKQIYLIFFMAMLLASCSRSKKVDVSNIHLDVKIESFDKEFDELRSKPFNTQVPYLEDKYTVFYKDFIEQIIQAGSLKDTSYYQTIRELLKAQPYNDLKHDVDSIYPGEMTKQNEELTDAFRRIKYYFPKQELPKVYAYFSGFEAQSSIGSGYFGIGLDLFLGANSRFYPALTKAFPHYLSRFFTPENITPRVVEGIARNDMFIENDNDASLLTKMIYNGKIMYFMDQVLPDLPDSLKIQYTSKQMDWCKANESNIWAYFLDENLLYETDFTKTGKYINVAPFTPGLGENNESAPRLGIWTGWQIVKKYMEKHPELSLAQLMAINDPQKILNESKYRPENGAGK